jgi:hypothetical protein
MNIKIIWAAILQRLPAKVEDVEVAVLFMELQRLPHGVNFGVRWSSEQPRDLKC